MKKLLFIALTLGIMLGMSNCEGEPEETGPFSLIGTWEASGDYEVNGDQRTYKSTLTFTETEYTELCENKSKQGTFHVNSTYSGTYTRGEDKITGTYSYSQDYHNGNPPSTGGPFDWNNTYRFIDKNTLEFRGPCVLSSYPYISDDVIYERKN